MLSHYSSDSHDKDICDVGNNEMSSLTSGSLYHYSLDLIRRLVQFNHVHPAFTQSDDTAIRNEYPVLLIPYRGI